MTNSAPPMGEHTLASDATRLHLEHDRAPDPRGVLLFAHGFGEHCGRYRDLAARLAAAGFSSTRFDFRGHGRSDGRRGHVFDFDEFLRDLDAAADACDRAHGADLPRFLLSHSNGGLVSVHALARAGFAQRFAGAVFSSPFFGFSLKVPASKATAGRLLSGLMPALTLPTGIDSDLVSHDPAVRHQYATDPLIGHEASARYYTESVRAHEGVPACAARLRLPVLFQQAGDDRIASAAAARAGFERVMAPDRTWIEYPGLFHEIWFELDNEGPLTDLQSWLEQHTTGE